MLKDFDVINDLGIEGAARQTAEASVVSAGAAVDAASLVFAHTITDACATRFLRVTAMIAPNDWGQILDDKKLRVADLQQHGYERALRHLVFEEMERIEKNEFLVKKVQKLQQLCRPEKNWMLPMKYDESRLIEIHERRRNVVHGDHFGQGKPQTIPTIQADLDFLQNLGKILLRDCGKALQSEAADRGRVEKPRPFALDSSFVATAPKDKNQRQRCQTI